METKKYAEIIDKGECLSTINVPPAVSLLNWSSLENVKNLAGKNEWAKYGFYPSNGLVGEIQGVLHNTLWGFDVYVLKIQNKYYVPMSPKGIKFITEAEMRQKQNVSTQGMDATQAKINSEYDSFMQRPFSVGKPKYKSLFIQDLHKNLQQRSNSLTINDVEREAMMYSFDICLEFDKKSDGLLTKDWTQHIVSEVCDAMEELINTFDINNRKNVMNWVVGLMNNESVSKRDVERDVNKYYNRI
jgi:hypothetical protein